ncbi:NUDIX domain-containing protein [Flavisphingomonas formosensis]|uniref:NUDIX domain-containing protein n=1 Tax=Flavisphingomonas formosensis TaxID=861534 RepID=UPI0012FB08CF|nr:NUDIX domain-containing protein [Sphingomonas formosensis]
MPLRLILPLAHRAARLWWFLRRPRTFGVRAIALTPAGEIVLVRHSYLPGWYCPGGGRRRSEDAQAAALRELREEIGMIAHGEVRFLQDYFVLQHHKRDTVSWFIVRDVRFAPRRSLEIAEVRSYALDALPAGMPTIVRERVLAALKLVP